MHLDQLVAAAGYQVAKARQVLLRSRVRYWGGSMMTSGAIVSINTTMAQAAVMASPSSRFIDTLLHL